MKTFVPTDDFDSPALFAADEKRVSVGPHARQKVKSTSEYNDNTVLDRSMGIVYAICLCPKTHPFPGVD